jgi:hypothetical protein
MLFKTFSAAVFGIDAYLVEVEVDVVPAFQGFFTVVLPDIAVKESRERIRAALRNCASIFRRVTQSRSTSRPPKFARKAPRSICPWRWDSRAAREVSSAKFSIRTSFSANSRSMAARERGIKNVVVPEAKRAKPQSSTGPSSPTIPATRGWTARAF